MTTVEACGALLIVIDGQKLMGAAASDRVLVPREQAKHLQSLQGFQSFKP